MAVENLLRRIRPRLQTDISIRFRGRWTEPWAEDVVQEALLDVVRGVGACRAGSEGELRAWLRTILRRQVALLIRHEGLRAESTVSLTAVSDPRESVPSSRSPLVEARLEALRAATEALTPDQATILWMRIQTHATWKEVGDELEIAAPAAKRRFQRLIGTLRRRCLRDPPDGRFRLHRPPSA